MIVKYGQDLSIVASDAPRAGNVLSIQLGDLEYAPTFGIDMRYFLESEFAIQTASFKAYTVQRLMESQVNVVSAISEVQTLFERINYGIGNSGTGTELIG